MSVARRALASTTLVALIVAFAAPAAAQTATVTMEGLPEALPAPLQSGMTSSLDFTVRFVADGFGCPQAGSVDVTLAIGPAALPQGVTATLPAEVVTISIPQGLYQPVGAGPINTFNGSAPAAVQLVGGNISANGTAALALTATFAGGPPANCQGGLPASDDTQSVSISAVAPPPPPPPEPTPEDTPAPGILVVALVAAAAAVGLRRRAR